MARLPYFPVVLFLLFVALLFLFISILFISILGYLQPNEDAKHDFILVPSNPGPTMHSPHRHIAICVGMKISVVDLLTRLKNLSR
jgi:hypothetical protein